MNLTPGASLWAIQQMLEGKKIRHSNWGPEEYIYIKDDVILSEEGEAQSLTQSMFNYAGWLLWTPPNPYPKGTFAWAWEELQRGKRVKSIRNYGYAIYWKDNNTYYSTTDDQEDRSIHSIIIADINSTNWELVE
jgi:hypothetical protein